MSKNESMLPRCELPAALTEKVTVRIPQKAPDNDLFRIFSSIPDIHKWHHYFEIYTRHLKKYRYLPLKMLEIGVYKGGSLTMWKRYFGPESIIVGVDIDPDCKKHERTDNGIFVRIGDQTDTDFLAAVSEEFGPFDVILDDGGHTTMQQIISFGALFRSSLKEHGCYMVEDIHTNYWDSYLDSERTFIDLAKDMIDMLHEPYLGRTEASFRYQYADAERQLDLSYLATHVQSITFHDSIIVFDKQKKDLPISELR